MTWDGTMETLNALTGNWAFEIRLYVKDGLTGQVFNNLSQASLKLYDDLVSSGGASFYLRNYVTMSEWTGWHVIRLEVADGNASLYLDGMFQATKSTGTTITPVTQDSVTAADIWIDYVKLENLTSGSVLWHSEYRDTHAIYKARDFSTNYQWPAVGTALRTIPWTDDYHFHFVFTVPDSLSNGSYWLMYQSNGRIVFSLGKDARGCRFTFGSFAFADNLTVYTPFQPSLAGTHDVTLAVSGTTLSLALDGTVYAQAGERTESSEYDRAVTTSAPVMIHEITLTDDTSSTEVWRAAYIDLNAKYPALPWPAQVMYSPMPRNFADNPMAWRDLMAVIAAATETDWSFKIRYNLNSADGSQRIFSPGNNTGPIAVFWSSEGILYLRTIGGNGTIIQANPAGDPTGTHTVEIIAASGLYSIIYDGKTVHSVQDTPTLPRSSAEEVIQSGMNGTILYAEFSCGKAVWRYPSEAERVRLITKTNIIAAAGMFKVGDSSSLYYVDTQLDLRGYDGDLSVVAHIHVDSDPAPASTTHYHILSQGGPTVSNTQTVYAMYVTRYPDDSLGFKFLISDGTRWYEIEKAYSALTLDKVSTIGVVLYKETREQRWFVNGDYIGSVTVPASWSSFNKSANAVQTTRIGPYVFHANYWPAVPPAYKSLLCFGRALSDGEIAAVSYAVV